MSPINFNYSAVAAVNIDNSYVLDVAAASSGALLAAACSSGAVRFFAPDPAGGLAAHLGGGRGGGGKNATNVSSSTSSSSSSYAHTKPATALAWHSGGSASLLSSSKDGTVACWDVRLGSSGGGGKTGSSGPAQRLRAGEPLHSVCFVEESRPVSSSPSSPSAATTSTSALVAAGGDGIIFLWDARTGRELACFPDTHEGDVSCLLWAPVRPTIRADDGSVRRVAAGGSNGGGVGSGSGGSACFLSAGVDGLVAVWDVSLRGIAASSAAAAASPAAPSAAAAADDDAPSAAAAAASPDEADEEESGAEDAAFVTALNANTSVSRLGLCGQQQQHLWATTGVEGLLTWDWGAACDEADASGGVGPSSSVDDARGSLRGEEEERGGRGAGGRARGSPAVGAGRCSCDYVVGCVAVEEGASSSSFSSFSSSSLLLLAAGDHSGRLALFPLGPPATARGSAPTILGASPMTVPAGSTGEGRPLRGHSATVRAITAAAPGGRALATGGEDGLVVLWAPRSNSNASRIAGREVSDDDDDDDDGGDGGGGDDAQRDFSLLRVSGSGAAGNDGLGVIKKSKKKRRHKKKQRQQQKDGGAAVEMALE